MRWLKKNKYYVSTQEDIQISITFNESALIWSNNAII